MMADQGQAAPIHDDPLAAYRIAEEPFYRPAGGEIALYLKAYQHRMPLILKGPTGCGKTRFVEYMAWKLKRPLVTLACNEDMTASDLVGRYLLDANGTAWHDGPLTDARRALPLDKKGELVHAHPDFQLVVSWNPGYQSSAKDMKPSTRQRFAALDFDYPDIVTETDIVAREAGIPVEVARKLVNLGHSTRALKNRGIDEGASTRVLIYAGLLMNEGVSAEDSCNMTITHALTDDPDTADALRQLVRAQFG